jgi:hemin uptake protein HemP
VEEKLKNPPPGRPSSKNETVEKRYDSRDLFRGRQEILIEHAGCAYRLRITRQDKLILTK